ncbi:MAG TPA: ZIP family metal transporter [Candidatus Dormibacteraeota bacterium]|nr:ZIP family metal transporter [Candidatus Dormibacteraeota bacterium]
MFEGWPLALGCGLIAGLANVAGGLLAVNRRGWDRVRQSYFVAAGAGFMLAAVLLRMIPESYRLAAEHARPGIAVGTLLLLGYLFVHWAEHVLVGHFHFGEETHHEHWVEPVVGTTALLGLLLHAFFDGVSIGSGFLIQPALGILVAIAIFLHKIPEGFTMASIMTAAGRSPREAGWSAAWLGLATLGGVITISLWSGLVRYALPFSAGAALYVAASDLIPAVNETKGIRMALTVFGGVLLFYGTETLLDSLGL